MLGFGGSRNATTLEMQAFVADEISREYKHAVKLDRLSRKVGAKVEGSSEQVALRLYLADATVQRHYPGRIPRAHGSKQTMSPVARHSWMRPDGYLELTLPADDARALSEAARTGKPPHLEFSREASWLHAVRVDAKRADPANVDFLDVHYAFGRNRDGDLTKYYPVNERVVGVKVLVDGDLAADAPSSLRSLMRPSEVSPGRFEVAVAPELAQELVHLDDGLQSRPLSAVGRLIAGHPEIIDIKSHSVNEMKVFAQLDPAGVISNIGETRKDFGRVYVDPNKLFEAVGRHKDPEGFAMLFKMATTDTLLIKAIREHRLEEASRKIAGYDVAVSGHGKGAPSKSEALGR